MPPSLGHGQLIIGVITTFAVAVIIIPRPAHRGVQARCRANGHGVLPSDTRNRLAQEHSLELQCSRRKS